jgi:DnaJ-class molecular chaperone
VSAVVVIIVVVVAALWWSTMQRHPIRVCPSCKGSKKNSGSTDQRWGTCRRCGGKGEVRRFGSKG